MSAPATPQEKITADKKQIVTKPASLVQKFMSPSFVEGASTWFGGITIVVGALAAVAGVFAWWFASKDADNKAAELKRFQEDSKVALAEARTHTAELELKTQELKKDNLELEELLAPRGFKDQSGAAQALKRYSGTKVVIEYIRDRECARASSQIAFALKLAGWNLLSVSPAMNENDLMDGVLVQTNIAGMGDDISVQIGLAADELVEQLNKSGMIARRHASEMRLNHEVILIRVGMKLAPDAARSFREMQDRIKAVKKL